MIISIVAESPLAIPEISSTVNGLGMKPAMQRIVILFAAIFTHEKIFHGCMFPVVRQCFDYRIPGAAIGTIDKRVEIPGIMGVEKRT